MGNRIVEIKGEIENYSDELGNQIVGQLSGNGKIVFRGKNSKVFAKGSEIGNDSYIQMDSNSCIELEEEIHIDKCCEFYLGSNSRTRIGAGTWFNSYMVMYNHVSGSCTIGEKCRFGRFNLLAVYVGDSIEIGSYSLTAKNVSIMSNDGHPIFDILSGKQINPKEHFFLKIGNHVWMGNGVIVMSQCHIGRNSMIGAGSFVRNKTFSNNCMIVGNPARIIRKDIAWNNVSVNCITDIDPRYIELTKD